MLEKPVSCLLFLILLTSTLVALDINPARSQSTVTVPDDYPTIQEAVNNANEGDTIFVRSGVYYENITVDKDAISLMGENSETTKIYCSGTDAITVASKNVSITNFTITGSGLHTSAIMLGMYMAPPELTTVAYNCSIFGNNIVDSYYGVESPNSGIVQEITRNSVFSNNILNNTIGIGLGVDCDFNIISGNTIISNGEGIMIESSSNRIFENYISDNLNGVHMASSEVNNAFDNLIMKNEIVNNQNGVFLETVAGIVVCGLSKTSFMTPEQALLHARIYQNNFMQNAFHVDFGWYGLQCAWDNGFEGNYWDDYNGTDSDLDGIGDTPYVINLEYFNGTDAYPLMNPYWISADVNHDLKVSGLDAATIINCYGSTPSSPAWNPHADIAQPLGKIDILDVVLCTSHYGEKYLQAHTSTITVFWSSLKRLLKHTPHQKPR